jgi:hypothetical protein
MISSPKDDANKNPKHNIGWSFKDVGSNSSDGKTLSTSKRGAASSANIEVS